MFKVGALLIFFVLQAFASQGQLVSTSTKVTAILTPSEHNLFRITEGTNGGIVAVAFLDENNNVKLKHERYFKKNKVNGLRHISKKVIVKCSNYFLITKYEEQQLSKNEYRQTGRTISETNDLAVYDEAGKVV